MTRFALVGVFFVNFAGTLGAHGNLGAKIFAGIFCVQSIVIFGLSLWRGMGGTAVLDWVCLGVALAAIIAWGLSNDPIVGVWAGILGDFAAYVPAFIKTWRHPKTESPWFYLTSSLSAFLALVAYPLAAASAFQIYIVLCGLTMTAFIYRRRLIWLITVPAASKQ